MKAKNYKPEAIPELGITGEEQDWYEAVLTAFRKAYPKHAKERLGLTKKNRKVNIFVVGSTYTDDVGDVQKGRFPVGTFDLDETDLYIRKIPGQLRADLQAIADDRDEGNLSRTVRRAMREYVERNKKTRRN